MLTLLLLIYSYRAQYNFVGRILGPRGMTAKQLEQETGCKIMVRGKGSMRDRKKVRIDHLNVLIFKHLYSCNCATTTAAI